MFTDAKEITISKEILHLLPVMKALELWLKPMEIPILKLVIRVAFADVPFANAELVAVPLDHVIPLPESISFETAATILLQGLTAHYLATDSHKTQKGETVLVHASAGGVGQFLTQISKLLGARVIGLTSSSEKAEVSKQNGADAVFLYSEDWKKQVFDFCPNGVDVVYDSIGSTLTDSFEVTKMCGQVVFFGMAGGDPEFVNPSMLMDTSKTLTGGDLWSYLISKEERIKRAHQLFDWIANGDITIAAPTSSNYPKGNWLMIIWKAEKALEKLY